MTDSQRLLADYVESGSESAFRELVGRYLNLVYSAARRLMDGDAHLAEDVSQTVFADFARAARKLPAEVLLGGWLHRHTCFVAANLRRSERRRLNRERQAVEMNSLPDHSEANLAIIAPVLDEAIDQLGAEDRAAVLLRFFEQRDFRAIGAALGSNEDAAQKRVGRALEKLHALLKHRGISFSAVGLGTALTAEAVAAAPTGLAVSISTAALAGAAGSGTSLTLIKIMTMTKLKAAVLGAAVAVLVTVPFVLRHHTVLNQKNEALREQLNQAITANEHLSNQVAVAASHARESAAPDPAASVVRPSAPVEATPAAGAAPASASSTNKSSILSSMAGNPDVRKMIRDQQRMGMAAIYSGFAKKLQLSTNQTEKLNDVLADDIMDNIDRITMVLSEGKNKEQIDEVFTAQEAALREKVKAELGPEAFAQYQDFTRNLLPSMTAEAFNAKLPKDQKMSEEQAKAFTQLLQQETQAAIARAGLDPDYQVFPILNFRNMASEEFMNQNLNLVEEIFNNTASRASAFLGSSELEKFGELRTNLMNIHRASLVMNRQMMSPSGK